MFFRKGVARKETRTNVAHVDANANGVEMDNTKANGNGRALAATVSMVITVNCIST